MKFRLVVVARRIVVPILALLFLAAAGITTLYLSTSQSAGSAVAEVRGLVDDGDHGGAFAFAPTRNALALSTQNHGAVDIRDLGHRGKPQTLVSALDPSSAPADRIAFSSDSRLLAVFYRGSGVSIWDIDGQKEKVYLRIVQPSWVSAMAFTPQNQSLVTLVPTVTDEDIRSGRLNYSAIHWDPVTGAEQTTRLLDPSLDLKAMSIDGRYVVMERKALANMVFDTSTGETVSTIEAFGGFCFSADNTAVVSYSGTRVAVWDVASGRQLKRFVFPSNYLTPGYEDASRIAISHDSDLLAIGMFGDINRVGIVSLRTGAILSTFECCPPRMICRSVRFAPRGRLLATDTESASVDDQFVVPLLRFWNIPAEW